MPLNYTIMQNTVGVTFIITAVDEFTGAPVNISAATGLQLLFFLPNQTANAVTASFYTDGTDGKITYTTQAGDLPLAGIYRFQAVYTISGNTKYTSIDNFKVLPNIYGL